jgi:hypothetical protein
MQKANSTRSTETSQEQCNVQPANAGARNTRKILGQKNSVGQHITSDNGKDNLHYTTQQSST